MTKEKAVPAVPLNIELRDYFAAQALSILLHKSTYGSSGWPEQLSNDAYRLADAMIAKRSKL